VIDGHDGAGKSEIARRVAAHFGGEHVRPFAAPVGEQLSRLRDEGRVELMDELAREAVNREVERSSSELLVFDRHWPTVLTMGRMRTSVELAPQWFPLPPTVICWTDVETSRRRYTARREALFPTTRDDYYCAAYRDVADAYDIPLVVTTDLSPELAAEHAIELLAAQLDPSTTHEVRRA
jgi:thymidylate kinase